MLLALYISALAVSDTVVLLNGKFNVILYSLFCSDITSLKIHTVFSILLLLTPIYNASPNSCFISLKMSFYDAVTLRILGRHEK